MENMPQQAKHIVVHGRVQGVGFRYFVQHCGTRLGLAGNVRNSPDYSVEIIVEGDSTRIEQFLKEVRKGPPMSRVERVETHEIAVTGDYGSFQIEGW